MNGADFFYHRVSKHRDRLLKHSKGIASALHALLFTVAGEEFHCWTVQADHVRSAIRVLG